MDWLYSPWVVLIGLIGSSITILVFLVDIVYKASRKYYTATPSFLPESIAIQNSASVIRLHRSHLTPKQLRQRWVEINGMITESKLGPGDPAFKLHPLPFSLGQLNVTCIFPKESSYSLRNLDIGREVRIIGFSEKGIEGGEYFNASSEQFKIALTLTDCKLYPIRLTTFLKVEFDRSWMGRSLRMLVN